MPFEPTWVGSAVAHDDAVTLRGAVRPWSPDYRRALVLLVDDDQVLGWTELVATAPTPAVIREILSARRSHAAPPRAPADGTGAPSPAALTIVVCTRERPAALARCLPRLAEAARADGIGSPTQILVVDNAPRTDATSGVVADAGLDVPLRRVVAPEAGLSRARNVGLRAATTDIVVFTDDDVLVDRDWLGGFRRGFARHPAVGLVTGLVPAAERETAVQERFDGQLRWSDRLEPMRWASGTTAGQSASFPYAAGQFGTGASMGVRRDVALELGGFDEQLGAGTRSHGGEDLEMFVRMLRAGYHLAYEPSAIAWHIHRRDEEAFRRQVFAYGTGLAAYVTALALQPGRRDLLRGASAAAMELGRHRHQGAQSAATGRPLALELAGMAWGAPAYLIERWSSRPAGFRPRGAPARRPAGASPERMSGAPKALGGDERAAS